MKYLVVKCTELGDQYECDADRTPICVCDDYSKYDKRGYEIYSINADGTFSKIRDYEDIKEEYYCIVTYKNDNSEKILNVTRLPQKVLSNTDIKKLKSKYHIPNTFNEIKDEILYGSGIGFINEKGQWVVVGKAYDNWYPKGC